MRSMFVPVLIILSLSFYCFGDVDLECDPENAARFIERCGSFPNKMNADIQKFPLWQGTDHPGYQLLDCKKGTIKNVIEGTGESYSCHIFERNFSRIVLEKKKEDKKEPQIKRVPDRKIHEPDQKFLPSRSSRASLQ